MAPTVLTQMPIAGRHICDQFGLAAIGSEGALQVRDGSL